MKKSVSIEGLLGACAGLVVLLSVLAVFNEHHRFLELLSHFRLQFCLLSLACAVLLLLFRHFMFALGLFCVFIFNAFFILPWYSFAPDIRDDAATKTLTIMHSNVLNKNTRYSALIEQVRAFSPDILVTQEVNQQWVDALLAVKNPYPYQFFRARNDNFGIAVFSRYPFDSVAERRWGGGDVPSILARVNAQGTLITVIATHPLPPISKQYFELRNRQLRDVAKEVKRIRGPVIVIGDLNVSMWSGNYQELVSNTGLRNVRHGFGVLPTWPAQFPKLLRIPIDHCLVSSHFVVHQVSTTAEIGSDHLPLLVELSIHTE